MPPDIVVLPVVEFATDLPPNSPERRENPALATTGGATRLFAIITASICGLWAWRYLKRWTVEHTEFAV